MTPEEIEAKKQGLKHAREQPKIQIEWPDIQELKVEPLPVLGITPEMLPDSLRQSRQPVA